MKSMPADVVHVSEESMVEVLQRYQKKGYDGQFSARPGTMVHCYTCGDDSAAEQVPLWTLHRFEGTSDPGEEAVVAGMECPSCGALGTLALTYGSGAPPEDMAVLGSLMDERATSRIRSGT